MASKTVSVGKAVPSFSLPGTDGGSWKSGEAKGKNLVVYFYPRDNTTGCTAEAQAFRDAYKHFKKANTEIVGISPDTPASHQKFKAKFELPFALLSDVEKTACELFDVIKEKSLYGRKYMGVERSTFLIDGKGVLRHEWRKVRVPGHVDEVLAEAKRIDA